MIVLFIAEFKHHIFISQALFPGIKLCLSWYDHK